VKNSSKTENLQKILKKIQGFLSFVPSFLGQNREFDFGNLEKNGQKTKNR